MDTEKEFCPSSEQQAIIDCTDSAVIVAGPGTGKTRTAIEKARLYADGSLAGYHKVLFLSFSNAAVNRMVTTANIVFTGPNTKILRFMTFHSLAFEILQQYGRFVGLPSSIKVMDSLESKLMFNEMCLTEQHSGEEELKQRVLSSAISKGIIPFDLMIKLAVTLLDTSATICQAVRRRYPLLLVDEFQDTSDDQWSLLKLIGQTSQVVAFGDPNQVIYASLHSASEKRIVEFETWRSTQRVTRLSRNFRCGRSDVLDFADALLSGSRFLSCDGGNIHIDQIDFPNQLRSKVAILWSRIRNGDKRNETIGILVPNASLGDELTLALRNPDLGSVPPFPVFAKAVQDEASRDSIMLALAAFRDHSMRRSTSTRQTVAIALIAMNNCLSSRSKTSKLIIGKVEETLRVLEESSAPALIELLGQVATSVRLQDSQPYLIDFLNAVPGFKETRQRLMATEGAFKNRNLSDAKQLGLFDELRYSRAPKGLNGYEATHARTEILGYHKAKGREFDNVILVVEPRGESNKPSIEEKRRLYYVCATRARKTLNVLYFRNRPGPVLGPVL